MRAALVAGFLFVAVVVGAAGASGAAGAPGATTVDDVATAIAEDGWYADGDAVGDREQLGHVAERLGQGGDPMGFALLAAEPAGSSPAFAEQVLDALPAHGEYSIKTVVVLSDADVGVVSDTWSDDAIDGALDDTIDALRADPTDGLEALSAALADQPSGFDGSSSDGGDDGGGGSNAGGLIAFGLVALVAVSIGSRYLSGDMALDGDSDSGDGSSSSWSRRRRRSFSSFSRRSSSSSSRSRSSRRSSSSSSHRGRGGRRL